MTSPSNSTLTNNPNPNRPSNHNKSSSSSSSSSSTSLTKTNHPTNQACAACKYQRRRCNPDCTLAPYFPAENTPQFLNAHRLFGVSNILKIIKTLSPHQRDEAMRSIIFQSNARAFDPIGGCFRIILNLQQQIERETAELTSVLQQLAMYRAMENGNGGGGGHQDAAANGLGEFGYLCYDGNGNGNEGVDGNGLEMEMLSLQQRGGEEEEEQQQVVVEGFHGGDNGEEEEKAEKEVEVADFVDGFAFSAKTLELNEEPDDMEHVQEHDLKEAASFFTLTNCNTSPV